MADGLSFRFGTLRYPRRGTAAALPRGSAIEPPPNPTFERDVSSRVAAGATRGAARAAAADAYLISGAYFINSALWSAYRQAQSTLRPLFSGAADVPVDQFRQQVRAALAAKFEPATDPFDRPNAPRGVLEDQLWSSFFAAMCCLPARGSEMAEMLWWLRFMYLYWSPDAEYGERARQAQRARPLMPLWMLDLQPASESRGASSQQPPSSTVPAAIARMEGEIDQLRRTISLIRAKLDQRMLEAAQLTQQLTLLIQPIANQQGEFDVQPGFGQHQEEAQRIQVRLARPPWQLHASDFTAAQFSDVTAVFEHAELDLNLDAATHIHSQLLARLAENAATLARLRRAMLS